VTLSLAPAAMTRGSSRWLLLGSLALNLFFIGIAISLAVRPAPAPAPTSWDPDVFVRMERIYGSFSRDFSVPASIDPSRIKATLKSGILRVTAGKSERAQPIPVEVRKR